MEQLLSDRLSCHHDLRTSESAHRLECSAYRLFQIVHEINLGHRVNPNQY
jgi:hypothetical protein